MKSLLPILMVIAAIGLFVGYTNPTYQSIKALSDQYAQYDNALTQSSQLRQTRDGLLSKRNTFATDDVRRLERLLPDNVDNIRLIIDINDIAARYHLSVGNVSLSTDQGGADQIGSGTAALGSVQLRFTVAADYNSFIAFMQDLEHSLRLIDIEDIKFQSAVAGSVAAGADTYTLVIRTYWLR